MTRFGGFFVFMTPELTEKQKAFVQEYLIDLNATQAAIRAGYSEDSARSIGCENLTKPDIQAAIAEALSERAERTKITQGSRSRSRTFCTVGP